MKRRAAPLRAKAEAVVGNVKLGTAASSPGPRSSVAAASSGGAVAVFQLTHLNNALAASWAADRAAWARRLKGPAAAVHPPSIASATSASSRPISEGRLNLIGSLADERRSSLGIIGVETTARLRPSGLSPEAPGGVRARWPTPP